MVLPLQLLVKTSDFDATEFMNEVADEVADEQTNSRTEESRKETVELDRMLRVEGSKALRKAKRRMEEAFMNDYAVKIKTMKREYRDEYEGEYNFIVKLGVVDNTVEVKETVTYCRITRLDDEPIKDEEYNPESEAESLCDIDEQKSKVSRSGHAAPFDPQRQITKYNNIPCITKGCPVIEINETPTETSEYHWLAKYECVPSDSQFNMMLNQFKSSRAYITDMTQEFRGVIYKQLCVGTNHVLNGLRKYQQFVIGNDFSIYRLGMNGSPNVNLGVKANAREKRFPAPINKKFSIASLFWANGLLRTQHTRLNKFPYIGK